MGSIKDKIYSLKSWFEGLAEEKKHIGIIIAVSAFLFVWKIWSVPIIDGDAAFYGQIAKNIVKTGDWLTLHFPYKPGSFIVDKPPLTMWLTAISFIIFGINSFGLTFWHSLMTIGICIYTYLIGKELFSTKTGLYSALILMTSVMFFYLGRIPIQDMPLLFFYIASFYYFIRFERSKRLIYYYLMPVFIALALLTKGPSVIAIPILIILVYLGSKRKWLFDNIGQTIIHLTFGTILFLSISLSWFLAEYIIIGKPFLDSMFKSNITRYFSPLIGEKNLLSNFIYIPLTFIGFIPWSGMLIAAMYFHIRNRTKACLFPAIWALTVFFIFSFSGGDKIARYILPIFPPLAILIGSFIENAFNYKYETTKPVLWSGIINIIFSAPLLLLSILILSNMFKAEHSLYLNLLLPFLILISISIFAPSILLIRKKIILAVFSFLTLSIVSCFSLIIASQQLFEVNPLIKYSLKINELAKAQDNVIQFSGGSHNVFMHYYIDKKIERIRYRKDLLNIIKHQGKVYGITKDKKALKSFMSNYPGKVIILEKSDEAILFSN